MPTPEPRFAVPFVKMEGCGNDYVFVDAGFAAVLGEPGDWAAAISDRHTGVGGDGLIVLTRGTRTPLRMRMWNADGSEGKLCLNGLRCAARYAYETGDPGSEFTVETAAGDRRVRVLPPAGSTPFLVEVEAGRPAFARNAIPATGDAALLWGEPFTVDGETWPGYGLSVGNPHLVLWGSETAVSRARLETAGPVVAGDPRFPEGVNVHLAARRSPDALVMRSWERGSGMTLACGTGAVAVFAAARRLGTVGSRAAVAMPGGTVTMTDDPGRGLIQRGPARETFRGVWTR
jgi:diaminopimelate epimerase